MEVVGSIGLRIAPIAIACLSGVLCFDECMKFFVCTWAWVYCKIKNTKSVMSQTHFVPLRLALLASATKSSSDGYFDFRSGGPHVSLHDVGLKSVVEVDVLNSGKFWGTCGSDYMGTRICMYKPSFTRI
jgi:hypothetical protein